MVTAFANWNTGQQYVVSGFWDSSNTNVATVTNGPNGTGSVQAVAAGTAYIEVQNEEPVYASYICSISYPCPYYQPFFASGSVTVQVPDHVSVVVDQEGYPAACPSTGVYVRQMEMHVVDANNNGLQADADIQESFSNMSTNTCGSGQPNPSSCAPTGNVGTGQFLDTMAVSGNFCGSGINQSSGCGFSLTSTWAACGSSGTKTLWSSPRITNSNGVEVNGSWNTYPAGTQFH